jgi:hypothetical protein
MQDAGYQNAAFLPPVENHMPALFHSAQAGADFMAAPPQRWIIGKSLATVFQLVEIADGLICTPCLQRVRADFEQIGFGSL